jgi:hypothetical protein
MEIPRFVLVIGAMKAGTNSVFNYLGRHPQIAACSRLEPEFFSSEEQWAKGLDWYQSLWEWDPARHMWALESSPNCTNPALAAAAAGRIASVPADFRFVFMVRDPIRRIESQFHHARASGRVPADASVDSAVDEYPRFVDRSRYAAVLDPYREAFGLDRLLLVTTAALAERPREEMDRVGAFLGLEEYRWGGLDEVHNRGAGRIADHPLVVWIRERKGLADRLRRWVPGPLRRGARSALGKPTGEPQRLSPDARHRAAAALRGDMERLRDVYGVDIAPWGFGGAEGS